MGVKVIFGTRFDTLESLHQSHFLEKTLIRMDQTHSDHVSFVTHPFPSEPVFDTDSVITQGKDVVLSVKTADCLPILIAHPSTETLCAIHSGRKGTDLKLLEKSMHSLVSLTESSSGFLIYFGPCICASHYEISSSPKIHYDLVSHNLNQLSPFLCSGSNFFYNHSLCTICHNDRFFSYRKESGTSLRFFSLISFA